MAKAATVPQDDPKVPATNNPWAMTPQDDEADALAKMREYSGKGVSTDAADNVMPRVQLIQPGSGALAQGDPNYIAGAKAGDFILPNSPFPNGLVDGNEGFLFQPCFSSVTWNEWLPRGRGSGGSGFVAAYSVSNAGEVSKVAPDAKKKVDEKNANNVWFVRDNGNEIREGRYVVGYALFRDGSAIPYQINFQGTGIFIAKQWNSAMLFSAVKGVRLPSFAKAWRLTSKQRRSGSNTWFVISYADTGLNAATGLLPMAQIEKGNELFELFKRGEKMIDVGADEPHEENASSEPAPF